MIGLAMKAGKVASGEFSTEKAVKELLYNISIKQGQERNQRE